MTLTVEWSEEALIQRAYRAWVAWNEKPSDERRAGDRIAALHDLATHVGRHPVHFRNAITERFRDREPLLEAIRAEVYQGTLDV